MPLRRVCARCTRSRNVSSLRLEHSQTVRVPAYRRVPPTMHGVRRWFPSTTASNVPSCPYREQARLPAVVKSDRSVVSPPTPTRAILPHSKDGAWRGPGCLLDGRARARSEPLASRPRQVAKHAHTHDLRRQRTRQHEIFGTSTISLINWPPLTGALNRSSARHSVRAKREDSPVSLRQPLRPPSHVGGQALRPLPHIGRYGRALIRL